MKRKRNPDGRLIENEISKKKGKTCTLHLSHFVPQVKVSWEIFEEWENKNIQLFEDFCVLYV